MWSLGSLRDSIRENARVAREKAKAAAEVAQGVLKAAAAEDDTSAAENSRSESEPPTRNGTNWDIWGQSESTHQPEQDKSSLAPDIPPPPSGETFSQPHQPSSTQINHLSQDHLTHPGLPPREAETSRPRSSRYVVTGFNTTQAEETPRHVPVPPAVNQFFVPNMEYDEKRSTEKIPLESNSEVPSCSDLQHLPDAEQFENETDKWGFDENDWKVTEEPEPPTSTLKIEPVTSDKFIHSTTSIEKIESTNNGEPTHPLSPAQPLAWDEQESTLFLTSEPSALQTPSELPMSSAPPAFHTMSFSTAFRNSQNPAEQSVTTVPLFTIEPPTVSEATKMLEAPSVLRAPSSQEATTLSEIATTSETLTAMRTPAVTEFPATVEVSTTPEMPIMAETPAIVETPAMAELPAMAEVPALADTPGLSDREPVAEPSIQSLQLDKSPPENSTDSSVLKVSPSSMDSSTSAVPTKLSGMPKDPVPMEVPKLTSTLSTKEASFLMACSESTRRPPVIEPSLSTEVERGREPQHPSSSFEYEQSHGSLFSEFPTIPESSVHITDHSASSAVYSSHEPHPIPPGLDRSDFRAEAPDMLSNLASSPETYTASDEKPSHVPSRDYDPFLPFPESPSRIVSNPVEAEQPIAHEFLESADDFYVDWEENIFDKDTRAGEGASIVTETDADYNNILNNPEAKAESPLVPMHEPSPAPGEQHETEDKSEDLVHPQNVVIRHSTVEDESLSNPGFISGQGSRPKSAILVNVGTKGESLTEEADLNNVTDKLLEPEPFEDSVHESNSLTFSGHAVGGTHPASSTQLLTETKTVLKSTTRTVFSDESESASECSKIEDQANSVSSVQREQELNPTAPTNNVSNEDKTGVETDIQSALLTNVDSPLPPSSSLNCDKGHELPSVVAGVLRNQYNSQIDDMSVRTNLQSTAVDDNPLGSDLKEGGENDCIWVGGKSAPLAVTSDNDVNWFSENEDLGLEPSQENSMLTAFTIDRTEADDSNAFDIWSIRNDEKRSADVSPIARNQDDNSIGNQNSGSEKNEAVQEVFSTSKMVDLSQATGLQASNGDLPSSQDRPDISLSHPHVPSQGGELFEKDGSVGSTTDPAVYQSEPGPGKDPGFMSLITALHNENICTSKSQTIFASGTDTTHKQGLVASEKNTTKYDSESLQQQTVEHLRQELFEKNEECSTLLNQADALSKERDSAVEKMLSAEKERYSAVEKSGNGMREARNAIENLQANRATAEARESILSKELEDLRSELDRTTAERNQLNSDTLKLKGALDERQLDFENEKKELIEKLGQTETEVEISKYESQKAHEICATIKAEVKTLQALQQKQGCELLEKDFRAKKLEDEIQSKIRDNIAAEKEIETNKLLVEEMKRFREYVVTERDALLAEKVEWERERNHLRSFEEESKRKILDGQREIKSLQSEKEESKQSNEALKEQIKDATKQQEAIAAERDRLLHERTSKFSTSEKEHALATECEQKTRTIGSLQRKLTSAASKIEKLIAQRGNVQRQRDDAGMRLRAAGAEFGALSSNLASVTSAHDDLRKKIDTMRDEKDAALVKVQEMVELRSKFEVLQENLARHDNRMEQLTSELHTERSRIKSLTEQLLGAEDRILTLSTELSEVQNRLLVSHHEKVLLESNVKSHDHEAQELKDKIKELEAKESLLEAKIRGEEAERITEQERSKREFSLVETKLFAEQKSNELLNEQVISLEKELRNVKSVESEVRAILAKCVLLGQNRLQNVGSIESGRVNISELFNSYNECGDENPLSEIVLSFCEAIGCIFDEHAWCNQALQDLKVHFSRVTKQLEGSNAKIEELQHVSTSAEQANEELSRLHHHVEQAETVQRSLKDHIARLQEELQQANEAEKAFSHRLQIMQDDMKQENDENARSWATERAGLDHNFANLFSKLQCIWNMVERTAGTDAIQEVWADVKYDETDPDQIGVLALRVTAFIVAEVDRKRKEVEDLTEKLSSAESEVVKLIDRAELAEQERNALRGTVERAEKKASKAHQAGLEEARDQYERNLARLEEDLGDTHNEASRIMDKANRSEKEAGELRALCNKLTSQLNARTTELDEVEEKLAYLQDQVSTLEEDLQEAHRRLKDAEEDSAQCRRKDVERVTKELEQRTKQLEHMEAECTRLRIQHDESEKRAKESEIVAQTHKQAEENLQIAVEQLEAAQDSAVEQRTIELEKKVREAEKACAEALERESAALISEKQLNLRDDEIRELRGAIGRLSDERVELKLELEKSLSRLNHPETGGQLVDRRVVRQLLVSYFRVGSVRRRDVLELMSRMLAFSEADIVAVGLKRRALMDRIGSLVQPPELDDATLPPLGTVSDKWIEFLMKETEEGEDQTRGW